VELWEAVLPSVQYIYDTSAVSSVFDDGARMESVIYPDGRVVFSDYGTSDALEDRAGIVKRLRETNSSGTILAEYSHTGSGSTVLTDYQQPDLKLDLVWWTTSIRWTGPLWPTVDHRLV
jgi:hypothetical protein